ncbi:MAG: hypothetical protein JKY37_17200, partial [Nannocystaceae bacterium]|nr:hypothetical protein [Nannocystaceae bacterium]
ERPTYPNGEACRYEEALLFEAFVTEALDAGLEYDQTCAGEHRQRLEQHGCEWAWDLADDCNPCPVVHGDKPVGVACEIYERNPAYSDCARGLLCPNLRPDQAFGSPVCVQACPTPVAVGESCKGQAADSSRPLLCVDGAYCKAGVCTQGAGIGERCASERDCTSRASCSLAEEDVRVCTPKVALGKMCDLANRCLEGSCLNELDAEGNTTSARSCVGPGEPCGVNLIGEQGGLTCVDGASVEVAGVCSNDVTRQLFSRYPS